MAYMAVEIFSLVLIREAGMCLNKGELQIPQTSVSYRKHFLSVSSNFLCRYADNLLRVLKYSNVVNKGANNGIIYF